MKWLYLPILWFPFAASAQMSEDFSNENFTQNPVWVGDTAYWQLNAGKLQSHFPGMDAGATIFFHLSTLSTAVKNTEWEFWAQLKFNTSSKNYVEVYLTSDQEDPRCGLSHCNATHGYFVRIGSTQDDICLYRRDSTKDVLLIKGRAGITNHSNNILKIKVTCDEHYQWSLYTDDTGTGLQYFPEGKMTDSAYRHSRYFSMVVIQSGKTAAEKHFFDDIKIVPFVPDTIPPSVVEIYTIDNHHVHLLFSEALDQHSAENVLNYAADNGLIMPDSTALDTKNRNLVKLFFEKEIVQKQLYHLQIKNIRDLSGNKQDSIVSFVYYEPLPFEVIMDEIYPDPSHSNGLPEFEYAEIKNISPYPINLAGWKFCNHTRCAALPMLMLQSGNFLILCDEKADTAFSSFGRYVNLKSFPVLNNNGDTLKLSDKADKVIHSIIYDKNTYHDKSKSSGGWSLEMKNTNLACAGSSNWTASTDLLGGTPGKENSVEQNDADDLQFLVLQYVEVLDSVHIVAHFNLAPDNDAASLPENYLINNNSVLSALPGVPLFKAVSLHLSSPLEKGRIYSLKVKNFTACAQIKTGLDDVVHFGYPEAVENFDIVINEILFHPKKGSKDFIEIYNHSTKVIDIQSLQLANRNKEKGIASIKNITPVPVYLFPNEFLVITEDKNDLMRQYFCKTPSSILETASLPSYPNNEGTVVLLSNNENVIDEVHYTESAQFDLFHHQEGVSLERISDQRESNDPDNWHSASSVSGYATPTYLNSQSQVDGAISNAFKVNPQVFSPDNDGTDDLVNIDYYLPAPGYTGKILVFDSYGRIVRHLLPNSLLGTNGQIVWDGKNDQMYLMSSGIYIVYIEIFNKQGEFKRFKIPVVLVKKSR